MSKKRSFKVTEDLENWMGKLPEDLKRIPFIHLAIPGSHDSMTSSITSNSKIAPDAEPIMKFFSCLGPITTCIMSRWAKTQDYDITDQLKSGIRYIDLRVATKEGTNELYFVHALYACEISNELQKIRIFIDSHPKEFVILDFQHFYELNDTNHSQLVNFIMKIFDGKLLPLTDDMTKLTLDYLTDLNNYQVAVVYRSDNAQKFPLLWPSYSFPNPWANTDDAGKLLMKLDEFLKRRHEDKAFISQCILTPSSELVTKHLLSSLKKKCAIPLEKEQYKWIEEQSPGPRGVNIVINDFVNLKMCQFAREIIELNSKLLK